MPVLSDTTVDYFLALIPNVLRLEKIIISSQFLFFEVPWKSQSLLLHKPGSLFHLVLQESESSSFQRIHQGSIYHIQWILLESKVNQIPTLRKYLYVNYQTV